MILPLAVHCDRFPVHIMVETHCNLVHRFGNSVTVAQPKAVAAPASIRQIGGVLSSEWLRKRRF
jgi:hypothetical protein